LTNTHKLVISAKPEGRKGCGSYEIHVLGREIEKVTNSKVDIDDSVGLNARLGYRMLSWLAGEVEYEWVPGFDIKTLGVKALTLESSALTANLRFILPTGRFQPYLKVGAGGYFATLKDSAGLGGSRRTQAASPGSGSISTLRRMSRRISA